MLPPFFSHRLKAVGLVAIFSLGGLSSSLPQSYTWKNVALSGAGAMVTGIVAHPGQQGLYYIRTDVGGSYRWDSANSKWIPLNDSLTFTLSDDYCCEAIAIDPGNVNVVYYAGGLADHQRNGAIFKSTDKGATWTQLGGISLYMDGNGDRRWAGERLMVSPTNSNIVLFGSRKNGLWRSTDAGATWAQVTSIPTVTDSYGVQAIAFDPTTSGKVYAAVSTQGVYVSTDSGATWTSIGGSTSPRRLKVGSNGTVWCTTSTGVSKYSGSWTNYAPAGANVPCNALGINPTNANDIIIAKEKANSSSSIWRTTNGGTSWTQLTYTVSSTVTWNTPALHNYRPTDFVFDPFNAATVWGDRWRTTNINAASVSWVQQEAGHEEDVMGAIIAPPTGTELLTGVFDDDGFASNNGLDAYPTKQLGMVGSWNGHTWGMAYQETAPANMVRIGNQPFYGGTLSPVSKSTDGGATWNRITTFPANLFPLACAVSATSANNIVVICNANYSSDTTGGSWTPVAATSPWRYTTNGGTTWSVISGLPTPPSSYGPWGDNQFLAADHINGSKYYYLDVSSTTNTTTGKIYSSTNGGATFSQANAASLLPANKRWWQIKSIPGTEGDIWACVDNYPSSGRSADEGLYRSTNSGVTWSKISSVNRSFSFGFGKPPSGATPALYIYGRVNGGTTDSIYRSLDLGSTWTNIQSPNNNLSNFPSIIEGSRQTGGRVFVGTGGRGVFYGTAGGGSTAYGGSPTVIPGTVQFENYNVGGEGVAYHDTTTNNNGGQYRTTEGVDIEACTDSGGGYDVSYTAAGEWMQYIVNATAAGPYTVSFRVASANNGASFHLENQSGTNLTGAVSVPNTGGWQTWASVTKTITLPAGQQTLKLVEDTGGFNLNYMTFTANYAGLPYGGTPASIPGVLEVENYDTGGQGVAYNDTTVNNNGGQYRTNEGVDIETCTDTTGGYDISYTAAGEWLKYTVDVAGATTYVATFRVASANTGATFHLEDKDGNNLTGPISVPNTGSWTTWANVSKNVTLPAGQQVLKIVEDTGGFNLNYILFN